VISKPLRYLGHQLILACDERCDKAWGRHSRPKHRLSSDPDDYVFKSDSELGEAPKDPGTSEGDVSKPLAPEQRLNKWCARECERSGMFEQGTEVLPDQLPDLEHPGPNIPRNQPRADKSMATPVTNPEPTVSASCNEFETCSACKRPEDAVNHVPGAVFVGWGLGWRTCPKCNGTQRVPKDYGKKP
jgi:hypothetical protein